MGSMRVCRRVQRERNHADVHAQYDPWRWRYSRDGHLRRLQPAVVMMRSILALALLACAGVARSDATEILLVCAVRQPDQMTICTTDGSWSSCDYRTADCEIVPNKLEAALFARRNR